MARGNRWICFLAPLLGCVVYGKHVTLAKDHVERPSVAIVGAGIGGSAASHFLRELLGDNAEIVVFESAAEAGGRTDHFERDGQIFETGASIVYTGNEHILNMTERFNLTRVNESKREGPNAALWDGERFVLTTTGWGLANIVKMARRYGRSLFKLNSMVRKTLAKFRRIYDLQANGRVFDTPEALWGELGLLDLTRISIEDHFQDRVGRPNSLVENELAHAVNRVNYNQGNELNALAGLVSLCPAVTGNVFKIEGGNSRLSKELLRASASEVHFNTAVSRVSGDAKSKYSLFGEGGVGTLGTFDAVIIAVPISLAGIALDVRAEDGKGEPLKHPLPLVEFQEVHVVFVRGVINRSYFGLGPKNRMPASVLLTESAAHLAFSSLSLHSWVGDPSDGVGVYKLFSRQELWTGLLNSLFVEGSWEIWNRKKWRAYPVLTPNKTFSPALLFTGHPVWYVSSLEESVSALEISAISAKNAALGVTQALRREGDCFSKDVVEPMPAEMSEGVRQEASREL